MSRQIWILVVSIVIVVFCGIWEINYFKSSAQFGLADLEYSKNALENNNFKLAKENIESLEETWNNMKVLWNIFMEHHEIDNIEHAMVEYKAYVNLENKEEALKNSEIIKKYFLHVVEREKVSIENIF